MALWNVNDVRIETEYATFQKAHKADVVVLLVLVIFFMVFYVVGRFCMSSRNSIKKQWRYYPGKILDHKKAATSYDQIVQDNEMIEPLLKTAMSHKQVTEAINHESRAPSAPPLHYLHS